MTQMSKKSAAAAAQPLPSPPLPYNFMAELTRLRAQHTQLQAQRTQLLWSAFTTPPLLLQQLFEDTCVRLPEIRALYSPQTFFDTSLTPMDNRIRLIKALSPLVPPERLFKCLHGLWQVMSRIMRTTSWSGSDMADLNDQIFALERQLHTLDKQNALLPQLLQMYEHVLNTSESVATMEKSIVAIQNDQVRENMLVLFENTKPLMETLFLVS
jgi:hypothetical protein